MAYYYSIPIEEMEEELESLRFYPVNLTFRNKPVKEWVYERKLPRSKNHFVRIYTGIQRYGQSAGESRKSGKDAIRIQVIYRDAKGETLVSQTKRVHRVGGWRKNLHKRMDEVATKLPQVEFDSRGEPMTLRKKGKNNFWGSRDYPKFKETKPFAAEEIRCCKECDKTTGLTTIQAGTYCYDCLPINLGAESDNQVIRFNGEMSEYADNNTDDSFTSMSNLAHISLPDYEESYYWTSADGNSRATVSYDKENEVILIPNFEVSLHMRGKKMAHKYLEELIDDAYQDGYPVQVIDVDNHAIGFWEKMQSQGLIEGWSKGSFAAENYVPKNEGVVAEAWIEGGELKGQTAVRIDYLKTPIGSRGLGRSEFENILTWAKKHDVDYIIIESESEAVGFWKKMGFESMGGDGELITMTYPIKNQFAAEDNYDATYGKEQATIRRKLKNKIKKQAIMGTKAGQWSARKSQELKRQYEAACDKKGLSSYKGKKTKSQDNLSKWSKQNWGTASGRKSSVTGEPYFPAKAVTALKKKDLYSKAKRQKAKATRAGKQNARYSDDIRKVVAQYRAESPDWDDIDWETDEPPKKEGWEEEIDWDAESYLERDTRIRRERDIAYYGDRPNNNNSYNRLIHSLLNQPLIRYGHRIIKKFNTPEEFQEFLNLIRNRSDGKSDLDFADSYVFICDFDWYVKRITNNPIYTLYGNIVPLSNFSSGWSDRTRRDTKLMKRYGAPIFVQSPKYGKMFTNLKDIRKIKDIKRSSTSMIGDGLKDKLFDEEKDSVLIINMKGLKFANGNDYLRGFSDIMVLGGLPIENVVGYMYNEPEYLPLKGGQHHIITMDREDFKRRMKAEESGLKEFDDTTADDFVKDSDDQITLMLRNKSKINKYGDIGCPVCGSIGLFYEEIIAKGKKWYCYGCLYEDKEETIKGKGDITLEKYGLEITCPICKKSVKAFNNDSMLRHMKKCGVPK